MSTLFTLNFRERKRASGRGRERGKVGGGGTVKETTNAEDR